MSIEKIPPLQFISTGAYVLDFILGGGIPKGKLIEFFGKPSSGKTSVSLLIAKNFIENKEKVAFFDLEKGLTKEYLKSFGISKNFDVYYSSSGEECILTVYKLTNKVGLIIIDSVPFILPAKDSDSIGQRARLITKFLEQLVYLNQSTTFIFLNQIRAQIGFNVGFGVSEDSANINALRHAVHLRLKFAHKEFVRSKGEKVGQRINITVAKSKVWRPQLSGDVIYFYTTPKFDDLEDILMIAQVFEIIDKEEGDYFIVETKEKIGNLRAIKRWIKENKEALSAKIEELLGAYFKLKGEVE